MAEPRKAPAHQAATVERFFIDHNSRDPERNMERLERIRKAVPATTDAAVITSSSVAIVAWVGLLKAIAGGRSPLYDNQIDELARAHPDFELVKSLFRGPVRLWLRG